MPEKRLAQALNFLYPAGFSWSEDPPESAIVKLFPVVELEKLLENNSGDGEQLVEVESNAILRFLELLQGKWFDIARSDALLAPTQS